MLNLLNPNPLCTEYLTVITCLCKEGCSYVKHNIVPKMMICTCMMCLDFRSRGWRSEFVCDIVNNNSTCDVSYCNTYIYKALYSSVFFFSFLLTD